MCGIVGIYYKNKDLNRHLGSMLSSMLVQMSERGPDSAGVAIYRNPAEPSCTKLTLFAAEEHFDWKDLQSSLSVQFQVQVDIDIRSSHAVVVSMAPLQELRASV